MASLAWLYVKYFTYLAARAIFLLFQQLIWRLNGVHSQIVRSGKPENYGSSAHLLRIVYRHKLDIALGPTLNEDFMGVHEGFIHPDLILEDNVTLYDINDKEAVFVEVPRGVQAWRSCYSSFIRVCQFTMGQRLIVMPISSFHVLAEKIGPPNAKLVFISNTARCGSTLLAQVFEQTGKCVSISEPDALNAVSSYQEKMPKEVGERLVRDVVRIFCKPTETPTDIQAYVLKLTVGTMEGITLFGKIYPDAKQIFMYRDALKVSQSICKVAHELPILDTLLVISQIFPGQVWRVIEHMRMASECWKSYNYRDPFIFAYHVWATSLLYYKKYRSEGIDVVAVRYEDLVGDSMYSVERVLDYCQLPLALAKSAVNAFETDSQANSVLNSKNLSRYPEYKITPKVRKILAEVSRKFDLPSIDQECIVDGLISYRSCKKSQF